jgi:plastocyanin
MPSRLVRVASIGAAVVLTVLGLHPSAASSSVVAAPPTTANVAVSDFLYTPSVVTVAAGGTVTFDFQGPSHHTVTDTSGMGLYDSGSVGAGGPSFSVTVPAAGEYRFTCVPHPWMGGHIAVPMQVLPRRGTHADVYAATWAAADAAAGYVYDVEIRRPGRRWRAWQTSTTTPGTSFGLHAGDGVYRFRARMRSDAGGATEWSPVASVRVG